MKKKLTAAALALLLALGGAPQAFGAGVYSLREEHFIAQGITRTEIKKFMGSHWQNINVVEADLNQPNVSLELLKNPEGTNLLNNVPYLATVNDAVAAVNGDFFAWYNQDRTKGSSLGVEVKNGELLSSPAQQAGMAAGVMDFSKTLSLGYLTGQMTVTAANGESYPIRHVNKYDDLTGVVLYNSKWDRGMSLGSYNNIIEVVVEDNIVTDIRQGADPIQIPENGYVLATLIDHVAFLKDNFAVGDEVKLDLSVAPSLENAKTAFGGGAVLVDNGTIPKSFSHNISGVNPRTALGVDASGKKVFLVTVDGRQAVGKGMTQTELAQLMVELGAYNAINLDGGGSTTMVTRDFWEEKLSVKNAPSDGGLRAVVNGLGITSQKGDGLAGVRLEAPGYTFVGAPVALTVGGHDAYQNPLPLPDAQNVSYTVTGAGGSVSGGVFTPAAPGVATITASYGASSYSVDIMVYEPARLTISPRQISMGQGGSAAVSITATSADGYSAPLPLSAVTADSDMVVLQADGTLYGAQNGNRVVGFSAGSATAYAQVTVGAAVIADGFDGPNGSYLGYPDDVLGSYEVTGGEGRLTFDFSASSAESKAAHMVFSGGGITVPDGVNKITVSVNNSQAYPSALRAMVTDAGGQVARLAFSGGLQQTGWRQVSCDIPDNLARPVKLTRLYVLETDGAGAKGEVFFDNLIFGDASQGTTAETLPLPEDVYVKDPMEKELAASGGGFTFNVMSVSNQSPTLINNLAQSRAQRKFGQSAVNVYMGDFLDKGSVYAGGARVLDTQKYSCFDIGNSTFMVIDNKKGGILQTDSSQWQWVSNVLMSTTQQNVFIFLPRPITDSLDIMVLKPMLTDIFAKSTRNVVVMYNGPVNNAYFENGVRYISLADVGNPASANLADRTNGQKYLSFTVNGDDVAYQFKNVF